MFRLLMLVAVFTCFAFNHCVGFAEVQTITASGSYVMGENDSPKIAKEAARNDAMRNAVEQAGVYVESYSRTQNYVLTEDDVRMISGAILKVTNEVEQPEVFNDTWKYVITITAIVDTDNLDLQAMMANKTELNRLQQKNEELQRENQELLEKYKQAEGVHKEQIGEKIENNYEIKDILASCEAMIARGEYRVACLELNKVIAKTQNSDAYPFYLRGVARYNQGSYNQALIDFNRAMNCPNHGDVWRLHYYKGMIAYNEGDYDTAYDEMYIAYNCSDSYDEEINRMLDEIIQARDEETNYRNRRQREEEQRREEEEERARQKRRDSGGGGNNIWTQIIPAVIGGIFNHNNSVEHHNPPPGPGHGSHGGPPPLR